MSFGRDCAPTLLSGTLRCGSCRGALTLLRAAGKYRQFGCRRGCESGAHGCTMRTTKTSTRLETAILNYVAGRLKSDEYIEQLVQMANEALAAAASRPAEDVRPLEQRLAELTKKCGRLDEGIATTELASARERLVKRLDALERERLEAERQLKEMRHRAAKLTLAPVERKDVERHLDNLQGLLAGAQSDETLIPVSIGPASGSNETRGARVGETLAPRARYA